MGGPTPPSKAVILEICCIHQLSLDGPLDAVHNYRDTKATFSKEAGWHQAHASARTPAGLEAHGAAHPHPEAVTDSLFRDSAFFDPNDLVQVKYEMLRSVEQDGRAVVEAAEAFGLSRPVYYVTRELFNREGLPGLLPRKRGPKRPHKLTEDALAVLRGPCTKPNGCPVERSWRLLPNAAASVPIRAASCDACVPC